MHTDQCEKELAGNASFQAKCCRGALDVHAIEFLKIWDLLETVSVQQGQEDVHVWRWEGSAEYSSESSYLTFFHGSVCFACADPIWKTWVRLRCKYFAWLAVWRRCWTAERKGLQNQGYCVFCMNQQEKIDHLQGGCAVVPKSGLRFSLKINALNCEPRAEAWFGDWWVEARKHMQKQKQTPVQILIQVIKEERAQWCKTVAKGLEARLET